jgi:hypothetical protein
VQIEGDGEGGRYEAVVLLPEDGPFTITWRAMDLLGNLAVVYTCKINRDTVPPLLDPAPFKYWTNTGERTFKVLVIDAGSGVDRATPRYLISDLSPGGGEWTDAGWEEGTTAVIHGVVSSSGEFELVLELADMMGNGASIIIPFGVDLEPPSLYPVVPWIINTTGGLADIVVFIDDPGDSGIGPDGLEFALDEMGLNWTPVPMKSVVTDGHVNIRFHLNTDSQLWLRGTDVAGNPMEVTGPFVLKLNEPPWVDVSRPKNGGSYLNPIEIDGRASSDPDGLELEYTWILDGSRIESEEQFLEITIEPGTHILILEVDDGFHTNHSLPIGFDVSDVSSPLSSPFTIVLIVVVVLTILTTTVLIYHRDRNR